MLFHYHVPAKVLKKYFGVKSLLPAPKKYMVMTGDSLINNKWRELLSNDDILFIGSRGGSIDIVNKHLNDIIRAKPEICIITANGFDIYLGDKPERVFEKYKYVIEQLRDKGITIIVQSALIAVPDKFDMEEYAVSVLKLNKNLKIFCTVNSIKFLELNDILTKDYHYILEYSDRNGAFPNKAGYELWSKKLVDALGTSK
ncbi:MAG: SGNH/GDSL hydrolase family protein [Desulfobacteraceae bacterium]|jgi:hypothetical protein